MSAMAPPSMSAAKRQLLEKMLRGEGLRRGEPVAEVRPRAADAVIPLSADQRQVWLHASMAPDAPLYNESITIHRFGPFDLKAIEAALDEILRRHESWRTGFVLDGSDLVQVVRPEAKVRLSFADVSDLAPGERDAAALAIGSDDAFRAIDLADAPLFRARIVKLADEEHRLYLTLHHIIFDGVSIYRVIVPELAALYEAFSKGLPSPLPEPRLQYGDYAVWQREYLADPAIARQREYWSEALAGAPAKIQLAGDRQKPAVPTHAGSMETFTLPLDLVEALKRLSRAEGATLYMTLLAAFKAMLHRYTGEEDIVVGGVTDLRRRPELEPLVGYFLNTIALRSRPVPSLTFLNYLAQVRETVLGALGASEVPFDEVVHRLRIRAQPGAHPLFNILFSIEPPVDPFPHGWDLTQMDVVVGAAKFDLYLELDERPEGMIGRFLYSTELFDPQTIRRMIGHWRMILDRVVTDPACRLSDLPLLTAEEQRERAVWNATERPLPTHFLPHAIASQATARPDAVALVVGDTTWSYAELERAAAQIASGLRAVGVAGGSLVAVLMDRSPEMVAALLAVLRTGAAYLPLDPAFPRPRLEYILADAGPDALLTHSGLAAMLPTDSLPVVLVDNVDTRATVDEAIADIDGEDLAYVLYTSGSTGHPKGVEVPHRALINLLDSMRHEPGFTAEDSLLAVTTLSFDIAALEIFLPLLCGGRLVLAARETAMDPPRLAALIAEIRPNVMQATPATWGALVEAGWSGLPGLRLLCGGEALSRELADRLVDRAGEVWNMYGPTETTIWSTVARVTRGAGSVPIGRPIANTVTHVLDAAGQPTPAGAIGELFIGGTGVAHGYRNRPDLTAERFGEKPVAPGLRLYRTGDLARYRADGTLFCLGRTDNDEKIRGFRVAVEEVEGALATHPAVTAAAVRSWADASGGRSLAAYLVVHGEAPTPPDLRDHLARTLPEYMIPSRFEVLLALPMTPNRKVDRKALPEPGANAIATEIVPPQGEAEERLAAVWREILGVEAIGRHDSFFDLGGHSLLVTRLLQRAEQAWGRKVTMAAFFRAHRLDEMAALLAGDAPIKLDGAVAIQPEGSRPPLLWLEGGPTFLPLARAVGLDQPFLGIPIDAILRAEGGAQAGFIDFARQIVAAVHEVRPKGPYYIGGWCTAGILAYEVARQLRAAGDDVPLLILAHATNPIEFERMGSLRLNLSKLAHHVRVWSRQPHGSRLSYLVDRLKGVLERMYRHEGQGQGQDAQARELRGALDRAAFAYCPPSYDGATVLFQPVDRPQVLDSRRGWAEVVRGPFIAHEIPGGHSTMLVSPHAEEFGALLREALHGAQPGEEAGQPRLPPGHS